MGVSSCNISHTKWTLNSMQQVKIESIINRLKYENMNMYLILLLQVMRNYLIIDELNCNEIIITSNLSNIFIYANSFRFLRMLIGNQDNILIQTTYSYKIYIWAITRKCPLSTKFSNFLICSNIVSLVKTCIFHLHKTAS